MTRLDSYGSGNTESKNLKAEVENKDSILFPQGYTPMMYLYGQQFEAIPPAIACKAFFSALMSSFLKIIMRQGKG